ncbi:hypothetical protein DXG01_015828 [Tephrocybe rancida]|nr:hypothetical protein DXG01_015828 [Tephrocybe rancida]
MLRASSLGCWPAQSQECRAMLIRAMYSQKTTALRPTQSAAPVDGNVAELSGSRRTEPKMQGGTSGDEAGGQGSGQAAGITYASTHTGRINLGGTPHGGPPLTSKVCHIDVKTPVFVLPSPVVRNHRPSGYVGRDAARKEGKDPLQRMRRISQRQHLKSMPRAAFVPRSPHLQKTQPNPECVDDGPVPNAQMASGDQSIQSSPKKPTRRKISVAEGQAIPLTKSPATPVGPQSTIEPPKSNPQRTEKLYITTKRTPHHVGVAWQPPPVKLIRMPSLPSPTTDLERAHRSWLLTLHESSSAEDAWISYTSLVEHSLPVPIAALHRTVRIFSKQRPKTYAVYANMLTLLQRIRAEGGTIHLHEWNALLNAAGCGLRKTTVRHYETALGIYRDMTKGRAPGTTIELDHGYGSDGGDVGTTAEPVEPDIYTYTTLIGIAARSQDSKCLRHARSLLERSGLPPNRFTHLALMSYFSATRQLSSVRSTLLRLERDRMELGLDGINALLQAYSNSKRLDVMMMVYRLLRYNLKPDAESGEEEVERLERYRHQLKIEEFIVVPDHLVPNEVTYTCMIQSMAYHGHLSASLTIFTDMLTALNTELGAPLIPDADGLPKPAPYQATTAIFRALFLAFRRHATNPSKARASPLSLVDTKSMEEDWMLNNLQQLFDLFISMPSDVELGVSTFYWIISAFQTASGNDVEVVRTAWKRLEERFEGSLGANDNRLRKLKVSLFPP